MKKISFEELCDLVAHVDYLWENTFPIYFKVDSTEYVAGIGYYDCGDDTGDPKVTPSYTAKGNAKM